MAGKSPDPARCEQTLVDSLQPELFKALCDPSRIALLIRLATRSGPLTVSEASECCNVHISGTSRHLAILKNAGIVTAEKSGREVRYRLQSQRLVETLRGLADAVEGCCTKYGCC